MPGRLAIGVDVGGTKVEALLVEVGDEAHVVDQARVETPALDAQAILVAMVGTVTTLRRQGRPVAAVGVGAAGMVGVDGMVLFAPNVAWADYPLGRLLGERVDLPVVVDNDANAAAWGEYRFGAGRGATGLLMVTVGTGIGGGIVIDGELFRGANGLAAEIGHVIVDPAGPRCGCGNVGCWEQVASGRALERLGRVAAGRHPDSLMVALAGGDPAAVHGTTVTAAAREGDPAALEVMAEVGRRLGEGIAGLVNVLDPELVVVGGGALEAGDLLLAPAREAFARTLEAAGHRPAVPLLPAALGNAAGAVGAADLALRHIAGV
jgi:glucokinase